MDLSRPPPSTPYRHLHDEAHHEAGMNIFMNSNMNKELLSSHCAKHAVLIPLAQSSTEKSNFPGSKRTWKEG